jgi:hypothetical protein
MFEDLQSAFEWAKKTYPGCSFSVKQQPDGPTIVSVKGKDKAIRTVVYVRKGEPGNGGKPDV